MTGKVPSVARKRANSFDSFFSAAPLPINRAQNTADTPLLIPTLSMPSGLASLPILSLKSKITATKHTAMPESSGSSAQIHEQEIPSTSPPLMPKVLITSIPISKSLAPSSSSQTSNHSINANAEVLCQENQTELLLRASFAEIKRQIEQNRQDSVNIQKARYLYQSKRPWLSYIPCTNYKRKYVTGLKVYDEQISACRRKIQSLKKEKSQIKNSLTQLDKNQTQEGTKTDEALRVQIASYKEEINHFLSKILKLRRSFSCFNLKEDKLARTDFCEDFFEYWQEITAKNKKIISAISILNIFTERFKEQSKEYQSPEQGLAALNLIKDCLEVKIAYIQNQEIQYHQNYLTILHGTNIKCARDFSHAFKKMHDKEIHDTKMQITNCATKIDQCKKEIARLYEKINHLLDVKSNNEIQKQNIKREREYKELWHSIRQRKAQVKMDPQNTLRPFISEIKSTLKEQEELLALEKIGLQLLKINYREKQKTRSRIVYLFDKNYRRHYQQVIGPELIRWHRQNIETQRVSIQMRETAIDILRTELECAQKAYK